MRALFDIQSSAARTFGFWLSRHTSFQHRAHLIERSGQAMLIRFKPVHVIVSFGPVYSSVLESTSSALSAPSTRTRAK